MRQRESIIILGSRCYDRDEIAIHLDKIGSAYYISADLDAVEYHRLFDAALSNLLDSSSDMYSKQKKILAELNTELINTKKGFDFGEVIRQMLDSQYNN